MEQNKQQLIIRGFSALNNDKDFIVADCLINIPALINTLKSIPEEFVDENQNVRTTMKFKYGQKEKMYMAVNTFYKPEKKQVTSKDHSPDRDEMPDFLK